jgi:hypothetical protein
MNICTTVQIFFQVFFGARELAHSVPRSEEETRVAPSTLEQFLLPWLAIGLLSTEDRGVASHFYVMQL